MQKVNFLYFKFKSILLLLIIGMNCALAGFKAWY